MRHALNLLVIICGLSVAGLQCDPANAAQTAADPTFSDPLLKVSSCIRPLILDPTLSRDALLSRTVGTHAPGLIAARLDVVVTPALLQAISATGALITSSNARWNDVNVEATPAELGALAALPAIHQIKPRFRPMHADEGDAVMQTDTLRSTFNVTGVGRTIGMISDTINGTSANSGGTITGTVPNQVITGMKPQVNGYLPSSIKVVDFGPTPSYTWVPTDEGEAMLEEVYAIAPGAPLAFGSCNTSDSEMATNIGLLSSAAGCTVIGDDISFLDEPFFQDGPIAQAINAFRAAGNLYFSAAGNNDNSGIMMNYQSVNGTPEATNYLDPVTGGNFHNWGLGGTAPGYLPIKVDSGVTIYPILEWNQPYMSWNLGSGSQSNFNMYLYGSADTSNLLYYSNDEQGTPGHPYGDPIENSISYTNYGSSQVTVYLAVDLRAGLASSLLRLVIFSDGGYLAPSLPIYDAPAMFGHCTAAGCIAVAAADYSAPTVVEYFSSKGGWGAGGIPFYFDTTGNPFTSPQLRNKPDLTAPDGISTSNPKFTPFFGTSAATPNAAACAALVWQAQPNATNDQIVARLEATAVAVTSPDSPQPDDYTGYGMVDGLAAATGTSVASLTSTLSSTTLFGGIVPLTLTFSQAVTVTGTPTLTLNTTPARTATYVSGSGSAKLLFQYQIVDGDLCSALDAASSTALSLNSGTIVDSDSLPVTLTMPSPGSAYSLSSTRTISIDAVPPSVTITAPVTTTATSFVAIISFSQPVVNATVASLTLTNATAGAFTAISTSSFTVVLLPIAAGPVTVAIAAGTVENAYGQASGAASSTTTYSLAQSNGNTIGASSTSTSGGTTTGTSGSTTTAASNGGGGGGGGGGCGLGGGMGLISLLVGLGWWRRRRNGT